MRIHDNFSWKQLCHEMSSIFVQKKVWYHWNDEICGVGVCISCMPNSGKTSKFSAELCEAQKQGKQAPNWVIKPN